MLARSCKFRLAFTALTALMALMVLGVTVFMGTSTALATGVEDSGSATAGDDLGECEATPSTISTAPVDFGQIAKSGSSEIIELEVTINQGKRVDCSEKTASIESFSIEDFTGGAHLDLADQRVVISLREDAGKYSLVADVPEGEDRKLRCDSDICPSWRIRGAVTNTTGQFLQH